MSLRFPSRPARVVSFLSCAVAIAACGDQGRPREDGNHDHDGVELQPKERAELNQVYTGETWALEAAIGEVFEASVGQTLTRDQFLYNVAQATGAKIIGG